MSDERSVGRVLRGIVVGWVVLVAACDDDGNVAAGDTAGDGGDVAADPGGGNGDAGADDTGDAGTGDAEGSGDSGPGEEPTWEALADIAAGPRQEHAVLAVDGEIWALGGFMGLSITDSIEIYDPVEDEWRDGPDLPGSMHHINAVVVENRIYITGYLTGIGFEPDGRVFWREIGAAGDWTEGTAMPIGEERGASAVAALDGRIYVAGGLTNNLGTTDRFTAYDTENEDWEPLPDLPSRRDHFPAAILEGRVCVAGGRDGGVITGEVDCYEPGGEWSSRTAMLTPRAGTAGAVLDGLFYVFGGEGNDEHPRGVFPQVEVYDFAANEWRGLPDMPTPRHGLGAATVGRTIYLPAGGDQEAFGATDVHEGLSIP